VPNNDPTRKIVVGYDPGSPINTGVITANTLSNSQFAAGGVIDTRSNWGEDVSIKDLSATDMLHFIRTELLSKLEEEKDTARLLYEEEGDDTSLGEYLAMQKAVEMLEKYLREAPSKIYRKPIQQRFSTDYKYLVQQYAPSGTPAHLWGGV
jgi:hypothetical protein